MANRFRSVFFGFRRNYDASIQITSELPTNRDLHEISGLGEIDPAVTPTSISVMKDCQVEPAEAIPITKHIDLNNPAAP
jgi:hypothetical protein